MEYSNLFVCLMGICTVFIGLICIIVLVTVMSNIVRKLDRPAQKAEKESAGSAAPPASRQLNGTSPAGNGAVTAELAAAVSAVIAEEMGTDVNGIRIVSFKKVSA